MALDVRVLTVKLIYMLLIFLLLPVSSLLAGPVALVEEVQSENSVLKEFDFLSSGDEFELSANDSITLGYINSCVRERIQGGNVIIGDDQSLVIGGKVERTITECDGGALDLSADKASKSGAMTFRGIKKLEKNPE